jgi:NADPH:quinone reductase
VASRGRVDREHAHDPGAVIRPVAARGFNVRRGGSRVESDGIEPVDPCRHSFNIVRMQAIVVREFGGPEVLKIEEAPDLVPGAGQVLVRVHAAGVNPFDTYMRTGNYAIKPPLPYTPGADGAGVVEAVGPGVTAVAVGARVFFGGTATHKAYGTYAQEVVCEPHQLHALPERLSFAQGAGIGVPYVTAWRALHDRARVQPGETVFIHGASGGVGLAATQIARAWGASVIGTASTPEGEAAVKSSGAPHVLNHREPNYLDRLSALTGGRGPDVIVESLANVNLDNDLSALAFGGRVVIVGNRGRVEIDPRKTMGKDAAIVGMALWNTTPSDLARTYRAIEAGLSDGTLTPLVSRELPLAEAARAHELVMQSGARGKIVLIP